MQFNSELRKYIRSALTCNWAGEHSFATRNGIVVQRTQYPAMSISGPGINRYKPPAPDQYKVIAGKSHDPQLDYALGRKISFFGRIHGTILPPRMLGRAF